MSPTSSTTLPKALFTNFLGNSPDWYKYSIIGFLIFNPISLLILGSTVTGWLLIIQFIFTLAMALKCYPLQPGGLLAIEAIAIGLASPETVRNEIFLNFPVILLLMFMVAGIYFMKDLLLFVFTKIILNVRSKMVISLLFCSVSALMSAFLDALTVTAVIISVAVGFYSVYHRVASGNNSQSDHDHSSDNGLLELHRCDLDKFRAFLRTLLMHGGVGTALGGVSTMVGEPQNLLIASTMDWGFGEFFLRVAPISMPTLICGLLTCALLEKTKIFDYGHEIPKNILNILKKFDKQQTDKRTRNDTAKLWVQGISGVLLVFGLAFHVAEVGIIGLGIIVLQTAFNGITEEHQIGKAFEEALPFTALLIVFFAIVAVIHEQHLFQPLIHWVLSLEPSQQPRMFFIANGLLSAISDNVFVATVYIGQVKEAFDSAAITQEQFNKLAVAINTGTNLPSVATPNGQAAFLFLLTSAIAPLVRLSYSKMVVMALPYTIVLSIVGYTTIISFL